MRAEEIMKVEEEIKELNAEISMYIGKINTLTLKRKKLYDIIRDGTDVQCRTCMYYDKLLNVCFKDGIMWKQVWDETEACRDWEPIKQ